MNIFTKRRVKSLRRKKLLQSVSPYVSPISRSNLQYQEIDPTYEIVDTEIIDQLTIWKAFDNLDFISCKIHEYLLFKNDSTHPFKMNMLEKVMKLGSEISYEIPIFEETFNHIYDYNYYLKKIHARLQKWKYVLSKKSPSSVSQNSINKKFEEIYKEYSRICTGRNVFMENEYKRIEKQNEQPLVDYLGKPLSQKLVEMIQEFILLTSVMVLRLSLTESEMEQLD